MTAASVWELLRAPFPEETIGKLPKSTCQDCSRSQRKVCDRHKWVPFCPECQGRHSSATLHLDFVGHAATTDRLLQADPAWTWEPLALDPATGLPKFDAWGGLWIKMTVHDDGQPVTKLGYGDSGGKTGPNAVKEAIGDAIRNAAMRFGVALDLWSKTDLHADRDAQGRLGDSNGHPAEPAATEPSAEPAPAEPAGEELPDGQEPRHPDEAQVSAQALADTATRLRSIKPLKSLYDQAQRAGLLATSVADKKTGEMVPLVQFIARQRARIEKTEVPA